MNNARQQCPVVLVVEDDPNDVLLLQHAAREVCPDIFLLFHPNGASAIAHLTDHQHSRPLPHLVLLDYTLPDMDGLQLLHWLRATPPLQQLWVLFWTDCPDPNLKTRAFLAGANGFVFKPATFPDLVEAVRCIALDARARAALA